MLDDRDKRIAGLVWAISGAFGPVVPLVIFALNYKKSKFIGFNALQAALSFLAMLLVGIVGGLVMGIGTGVVLLRDGMPDPGTPMPEGLRMGMLLVGGLAGAVYLALIVLSLRFASQASKGSWVRYPIVSRLAATLYDVSDVRVAVAKPDPA